MASATAAVDRKSAEETPSALLLALDKAAASESQHSKEPVVAAVANLNKESH